MASHAWTLSLLHAVPQPLHLNGQLRSGVISRHLFHDLIWGDGRSSSTILYAQWCGAVCRALPTLMRGFIFVKYFPPPAGTSLA